MNRLALTFSATMAIVVGFVSSLVSKAPDWVATNIFGRDSSFHYVLSSNLKYDLLALGILAALSPQLFLLGKLSLASFIRLVFHASYCLTWRKTRLVGFALTTSLLVAALSAGELIHAIAAYAYVAAREYKHHEDIDRQRQIEAANELGKTDLTGSIAILRGLLKRYPDDYRNSYLATYVESYDKAKSDSDQLMSAAEGLAAKNEYSLAIVYYQLATKVIVRNKAAEARLAAYEAKFNQARPVLVDFYNLCKSPSNLPTLISRIDEFSFAVKEPNAVRQFKQRALAGDDSTRIYLQICSLPLHYKSAPEYLSALQRRIFQPEQDAER